MVARGEAERRRMFTRAEARCDHSTPTQRKQLLRERQCQAREAVLRSREEWAERAAAPDYEQRPPPEPSALFSAHDVNPQFPHRIQARSPHPPPAIYDYDTAAIRLRRPPSPAIAAAEQTEGQSPRSDVIVRRLARAVRGINDALRRGLDEKPPPEQPAAAEEVLRAAKLDPRMTMLVRGEYMRPDYEQEDAETRAERARQGAQTPPPFHSTFRPRTGLGWERQPDRIRRDQNLEREVREWQQRQTVKANVARKVRVLARRQLEIVRLRKRMRDRFEHALLRNEPHALKKLEDFLRAEHEAACRKEFGHRCRPIAAALLPLPKQPLSSARNPLSPTRRLSSPPTLANAVVELFRAGQQAARYPTPAEAAAAAVGTRPVGAPPQPAAVLRTPHTGTVPVARCALAPTPEGSQEPTSGSSRDQGGGSGSPRRRGPARNLLVPAPPPAASRRDSRGELLHSSRLSAPRPARLISPASERICARLIREGRKLQPKKRPPQLAPAWDLSPEETAEELACFEDGHLPKPEVEPVSPASDPESAPPPDEPPPPKPFNPDDLFDSTPAASVAA